MRFENRLSRDIMTRDVVTVPMNDPVKHIADLLSRKRISSVVVTDNVGEAMGVISDMDILKVIGKGNWEKMTAENIMTHNLEFVKPTSTLTEAAGIMGKKHIHRLLVFSEGGVGASHRPIGIVSASDIVREAARE
jgi:CBS domain-containing protein